MGKRMLHVVVVFALFFAVGCTAATVAFGQEKVIKLRYSDQFPPNDPLTKVTEAWCKEVAKRTAGKVKVTLYPASTLNGPGQMYESILQGVVDVGNHFIPYTPGRFPQMNAVDQLPWSFGSDPVKATKLANAFYQKFRPKELDGVKVMYFHMAAPNIFVLNKPLNKLSDLRGMRLRSLTPNAQIIGKFGATAVAMPMPEVYDALSKNAIQGVLSPYLSFVSWKLADHAKYVVEYDRTAMIGFAVVAMNKQKWESLAPDVQKIIEEINKEWALKHAAVWAEGEKEGKAIAIKKGVKVSKLSAGEQAKWDAAAAYLFDDYVTKMKKANLPGEEALQFIRAELK